MSSLLRPAAITRRRDSCRALGEPVVRLDQHGDHALLRQAKARMLARPAARKAVAAEEDPNLLNPGA
jgi:hypothetical protein